MEDVPKGVATIVAEIKLSYRPKVKPSMRPQVCTAEAAYKIFIETWDKDTIEFVEQFKVMLLNRANRVLGICLLSSGTAIATIVDPKLVFVVALKANANEIILAHNHPSGSLKPSNADYQLTYKLKSAGDYLELRIVDHLIISPEGFYSFAGAGVL